MDKETASKIIRETFNNSFDKDRFIRFTKELFNYYEPDTFIYRGNFIPDAFDPQIKTLERVGKYTDSDGNKIDILIVKLKRASSIERARTMQRNFIAWYLNGSRGGELKDAAIVAFIAPDHDDWRFSLVKMDYHLEEGESGKVKTKKELTPARRWSFLVGENENSHTAQKQLLEILQNDSDNKLLQYETPLLSDFEQVFNIEKVTKEFFEKYRELFINVKEALEEIVKTNQSVKNEFEAKSIDTVDFAKKLLGQIVFLYFLQKKGWFGVPRGKHWGEGDKHFLRHLQEKAEQKNKNFFNDYLEPLFYQALRYDRSADDDYFSQFDCKIPFLNGGLFDPMNDYDWINTDVVLPNDLFANEHKTKEGDIGTGILDVFDRYNFTVKEDEPLEKDVAVDPEMLGRAYEKFNAIRADNYEEYLKALKSGKKGEESKFNKQYGVYYTPREIVHYMCQESLANYLATELTSVIPAKAGIQLPTKEDIETLIKFGETAVEHDSRVATKGLETKSYSFKLPENIRKNAKLIDEKLATIRVCDPAVGSGAFPVGMMSEIIRTRNALTPYIPTRHSDSELVEEKESRTPYNFKRHAVQNSLYGVDIDPGAIEIAKLRLWLSLVVDEEERATIQPLPNLDYKIMQGNSLLSIQKTDTSGTPDMFYEEKMRMLHEKKQLYFNETSASKKKEYKEQIDELISHITNGHTEFDFEVYFSEVFHLPAARQAGEKQGFDVVIANPPYISHDKIIEKKLLQKKFKAYESFADLYCYFLELAVNLQNRKGLLCYITSNSYLKAEYGKPLRNLLLAKDCILSIINIEDFQVFGTAIVNIAVIIAQRRFKTEPSECLVANAGYDGKSSFEAFVKKNKFFYSYEDFQGRSWYLLPPQQLSLKRKLEQAGKTLEMYKTKIRLGIATGANDVFIVSETQKNELIRENSRSKNIIKPILRGRDIFRYKYQFNNSYIILAANGIDIKREYPEIFDYLDSFGDTFKKRGAKGEHWSNLRPTAFLDDFKREKIIWIELTDKGRFALCSEEMYLLNSAYFLIPPMQLASKYLLAILNSKLMEFYLGLIAETSGMGVTRWINNYVKDFPIIELHEIDQKPFIEIVDKILAITKDKVYLQNPAKQAKVQEYENQIDQLVYKLYDLTPEEIKIIEKDE